MQIKQKTNPLPLWTWPTAFVVLHLATRISIWSQVTNGSSLFYFPVPIALVLTYWWGPRVLVVFYLNAVVSAGLWGLENPFLYPLYALPEVLFVGLSWLFFIVFAKGKSWLPNIRHMALFLTIGIFVPLVIYKFLLEALFLYFHEIRREDFWTLLVATGLGDFLSIFGFSVPFLYFMTGPMSRRNLTLTSNVIHERISALRNNFRKRSRLIELILIILTVPLISQYLNFIDYWFIYGIISIYTAIRFGFGAVIVINSYILLLTYVIPAVENPDFTKSLIVNNELIKIQLGSGLLYVFSIITGRVMSDVGAAEKRLSKKNEELERTNKELDRFVYSVSHDLSAPLKSILGLVNISRLANDPNENKMYLNRIESSVQRLESFIEEILDYSKNKRQDVKHEKLNLKALCTEIFDNLKYVDDFHKIKIDLSDLSDAELLHDKMRLKIILNNLLTNAVKFQKRFEGHAPMIKVSSQHEEKKIYIKIEDNGEGIRPELQGKIFDMFFRATENAKGSGLGLYIAREAALRINGELSVNSQYGIGTTFTLALKNNNED